MVMTDLEETEIVGERCSEMSVDSDTCSDNRMPAVPGICPLQRRSHRSANSKAQTMIATENSRQEAVGIKLESLQQPTSHGEERRVNQCCLSRDFRTRNLVTPYSSRLSSSTASDSMTATFLGQDMFTCHGSRAGRRRL
jgi:hypothetical protein